MEVGSIANSFLLPLDVSVPGLSVLTDSSSLSSKSFFMGHSSAVTPGFTGFSSSEDLTP